MLSIVRTFLNDRLSKKRKTPYRFHSHSLARTVDHTAICLPWRVPVGNNIFQRFYAFLHSGPRFAFHFLCKFYKFSLKDVPHTTRYQRFSENQCSYWLAEVLQHCYPQTESCLPSHNRWELIL